MMGTSGSASRTCQTQRTATGRIAGPDRPAGSRRPARGAWSPVSMAIPGSVLIIESPSAPAPTQARAIATMSVTSGDSLANTGMSYRAPCPRTAATTAPAAPGVEANGRPAVADVRAADVHLDGGDPGRVRQPGGELARTRRRCRPAMDTTARAPRDSSQGRSRWRNASMPGPCRPTEYSIPLGVSAIRGVGLPARGSSVTDLVITAPILATSKNWASSRPAPGAPRRGQDRLRQLDVTEPGPQVSWHWPGSRPG